MMDMNAITRSEKMCNPCQLNNESKKVESWCTVCAECAKDHRKFRMTLNHKRISIEELKSCEAVVGKSGIVFCDEHPDKAIEVFCDDHSKPCYTLCETIHHRKCDSETTIDKATSGIKTAINTTELYQKLKHSSKEIYSSLQINEYNETAIDTKSTNIISEIERSKVTLSRMENELKKKSYQLKREKNQKL